MDRNDVLRKIRERYSDGIWALLGELEETLSDYSAVRNVDISDSRAIGSVLNAALPNAAAKMNLATYGLSVEFFRQGSANKLSGKLDIDGHDHSLSLEIHLGGPRGGTSKGAHQFADVETEPMFDGFDEAAPPDLLLFVVASLAGSGVTFHRASIRFADNVDRREIEIHRNLSPTTSEATESHTFGEPKEPALKIKERKGEHRENGSTTNQRRDAAPSSK